MRRVWILCAAVCILTTSAAIAWGSVLRQPAASGGSLLRARLEMAPLTGREPQLRIPQRPARTRRSPARPSASGHFLFGDRKVESRLGYGKPGVLQAFAAASHSTGTATSLWVYVSAHNRATTLSAALYSDKNGHIGVPLTTGHVAPKAAAWNEVGLRPVPVKPGTTYWIAVLGRRASLYFRERGGSVCGRTSTCPISAYVTGRVIGRTIIKGTRAPSGAGAGLSGTGTGLSGTGTDLGGTGDGPGGTSTSPVSTPPLLSVPPLIVALPEVTGQTVQGGTLSTTPGTWNGTPTAYSYAWEDCDTLGASCTSINNATASSYTLTSNDVGHTIRSVVTASNGAPASAQATSVNVGPVTTGSQSCASYAANTPGGPDPWGGCFPGPENTGVPAGTTLTHIPASETVDPGSCTNGSGANCWSWNAPDGNLYVRSCGVTINAIKLAGNLVVYGIGNPTVTNGSTSESNPCVTVENSEIDGQIENDSNDGTAGDGPLVLLHDYVNIPDGQHLGNSPVLSGNYYAHFLNVQGGELGFACWFKCSVSDSYVHDGYLACTGNGSTSCTYNGQPCSSTPDPTSPCGYHYDPWGLDGSDMHATHDTFTCTFDNVGTAYANWAVNDGAGCSATVGVHADDNPTNNDSLENSLITANSSANGLLPQCVDMNNPDSGKPYPFATNVLVENNVFEKQDPSGSANTCARFGVTESWTYGDGNVWSGNTYDDGSIGPVAPRTVNLPPGPTNTALPVITGTPGNGNTLTVSTGSWNGATSYQYRWMDCETGSTVNCLQVNYGGGVTTASYTMRSSDTPTYASGYEIKAVVTACGATGCTNADAAAVH